MSRLLIIPAGAGKANDCLKITVMDEPGPDGMSRHYQITGFDQSPESPASGCVDIVFQRGEASVNGVTPEVLLAIVADWFKQEAIVWDRRARERGEG